MKRERFETDCWLWPFSTDSDGYGQFVHDGRQRSVHRFLYELLIGKVAYGTELDHQCEIRRCINPTHLKPVTHAENMKHKRRSKVTWEMVKEIRELHGKMTHRKIAEKFKISDSHVGNIIYGRYWEIPNFSRNLSCK